jgi:hypothetical protein
MRGSNKKDSVKINTVKGQDIYLDPESGLFFFGPSDDRLKFETLREAEIAARGEVEPVKVVHINHHSYPEVVEIIACNRWNLLRKDGRKQERYNTYKYDKAKVEKLWKATEELIEYMNKWQWATYEISEDPSLEIGWSDDLGLGKMYSLNDDPQVK